MDQVWLTASLWMALALGASLISIRIGLSVALAEIFVGAIGGNFFNMETTPWINFLAGFGSVLLTFLAGAEIDPAFFRRNFKASISIGFASFLVPFLAAWLFAYFVGHWDMRAAQIAGVALSTTSVAVVYAVLVETGASQTDLGKLILAACFVTDLGTVIALGVLFANFNLWMVAFVGALLPSLWLVPKLAPRAIAWWGKRVSDPALKFFFLVLFALGWLATSAKSEAVLPAYLIGMASAGVFLREREALLRMRTVAFALLTPFFFLKAGLLVSLSGIGAGFALILAFLAVKVGAKSLGVWPLCRAFHMGVRESNYTTLLMSTGLTFGSISALFGLNNHIIDQEQYTILVTTVVVSAVAPTIVAQAWFRPRMTEPQPRGEGELPTTAVEGAPSSAAVGEAAPADPTGGHPEYPQASTESGGSAPGQP